MPDFYFLTNLFAYKVVAMRRKNYIMNWLRSLNIRKGHQYFDLAYSIYYSSSNLSYHYDLLSFS